MNALAAGILFLFMKPIELVNKGKTCTNCLAWKPIEDYYASNRENRIHKHWSFCKECADIKHTEYRLRTKKKCETCNSLVLRDRRFCRKCSHKTPEYLLKNSKRVYRKRINRCIDCNKQIASLKAKRCTQCRSKGSNNPQWKGGVNPLQKTIRGSFQYMQWRTDVYTRDGFSCLSCGLLGGDLNAHHITPFSSLIDKYKISNIQEALGCGELWNINNGMTLCKKCHVELHKKKGYKK